jgi:thimet oligopeptidase
MKKIQRTPFTKADFEWVSWKPNDFTYKVRDALNHKKAIYVQILKVKKQDRTFENTIFALEISNEKISYIYGILDFLLNVSPDKTIRDAATSETTFIKKELVDIEHNKALYDAVMEYSEKKEKLSGADLKLFEDTVKGYKRMGFHLPEGKQIKLKNILKKLSKLETLFTKTITDHKDHITISSNELQGLPQSFLERLSKDAKGRYIVSLDYPESGPFMDYSSNESKRKELYMKLMTKGFPKNKKLLVEIVDLRKEFANLLGYKTYADYVAEVSMAKTAANSAGFINDLLLKVQKKSDKDLHILKEYKRQDLKKKQVKLENYDIAYYTFKATKARYDLDLEQLREYFPLPHIVSKVFELYGKIFSLKFVEMRDVKLWHPDVKLYQVYNKSGSFVGCLSLDLYPRLGKYTHMAMFQVLNGYTPQLNGIIYKAPYVSMVGNFTKPTKDNPSLISHAEAETYFHEFGHLMHGLLTQATYESQSGTNTSTDFVEIPSQLFENWIWNEKILGQVTCHYKTGKPMPKNMMQSLLKSKDFLMGYWTMRQLIFATLDLTIHTSKKFFDFDKKYEQLVKKHTGMKMPKGTSFNSGWGHLLGYAGKYYSYMWSLVYAYDVFTRFKTEGILNIKTGKDLRELVLSQGSSKDEMQILKDFLGRAPNNKAFLKELGL